MSAQCESVPKKIVPLDGTMAAVVASSDTTYERIAVSIIKRELPKQTSTSQASNVFMLTTDVLRSLLIEAQQQLCLTGYQRDFNPHQEVAAYDLEIAQVGAGVLVIPKTANMHAVLPLSFK